MNQQRYDYIDIAKGTGILLVVWAHIMITGWTHQMIYAFHMPLFFLLSGMLFRKEKYSSFSDFFVHRFKRLFIPYIIYSVATWLLWAGFRYVRHDEVDSYFMPLLQTFIAQGSGAYMVHNSALWFIPCLFLVEILFYFISKMNLVGNLLVCFICAAISFILGHLFEDKYWFLLPWNADAALIALPFYAVGNAGALRIGHERMLTVVTRNKSVFILSWTLLTGLLYWSAISFGECSMGSSSYQCDGWVFMLRAFLGCVWLVLGCLLLASLPLRDKISRTLLQYMKWAGINSLDIMCLHIPVKGICMIIVAVIVKETVDSVSCHLGFSFFAFLLTMLVVWIAMRLFPINKIIKRFHLY